jgi:hypothetical protein
MILDALESFLLPLAALAGGAMLGWWVKSIRHQVDRAVLDELWTRKLKLAEEDVRHAAESVARNNARMRNLEERVERGALLEAELDKSRRREDELETAVRERDLASAALAADSKKLARRLGVTELRDKKQRAHIGLLRRRVTRLDDDLWHSAASERVQADRAYALEASLEKDRRARAHDRRAAAHGRGRGARA